MAQAEGSMIDASSSTNPHGSLAETPVPIGQTDPAALARRVKQLNAEVADLQTRLANAEEARLRAETEWRRNAVVDDLTGLHTRRAFLMLTDLAWKFARRSGVRCALMYADVDGLQKVNTMKGWSAGDDLLRSTARVLRQTLRDADVVARVSGDEFAVFGLTGEGSASMLISRLQDAIAQQNHEMPLEIPVALSVGAIDVQWSGSVTLETLLSEAERAMHQGKRRRKEGSTF